MRRINVVLLEEADKFVEEYQKESRLHLDETINEIILKLKNGK